MGLSWLVATSRTLHHCRQQSTRVSDCSLGPDSRLPSDPFWLKLGIGSLLTRSLVSRVRLLERSVTKKTPINAICSVQTMTCLHLNVQGQLVRSQRWFWSRRTKQLYRNRYWLTPQVRPKTVKQRHFVCSDGDSTNMWRLCIAPKIWTKRWLDGTVEHESMGTRHDNRALAARLADFLQVAYRQYQSTLWKYHRDRIVEVG
ncbi:hypothetical protein BASA81_013213 [Batrachochytrium salamandrivorans]|nr:hypothetical protein BASA81_013213 [Batrachochytrium salamandrivorans]